MLSLATRTEPHALSDTGIELNDVHSRLNATRVGAVIRPADVAGAVEAVRAAAHVGEPLAVMGARHALGGQQFLSGGRVLDIEIGRPACRERVCQYVWNEVGAETLKKKYKQDTTI